MAVSEADSHKRADAGSEIPKKYGYTIIVSGPQGPTGKTTVTRILRKLGIDACEKYLTMEIEVDKPLENYEVDTEKFFKSIKFSNNGEE